jgi:hypothetical protein
MAAIAVANSNGMAINHDHGNENGNNRDDDDAEDDTCLSNIVASKISDFVSLLEHPESDLLTFVGRKAGSSRPPLPALDTLCTSEKVPYAAAAQGIAN